MDKAIVREWSRLAQVGAAVIELHETAGAYSVAVRSELGRVAHGKGFTIATALADARRELGYTLAGERLSYDERGGRALAAGRI